MARDTTARNTARKAQGVANYAMRDVTPFYSKDIPHFQMLHDMDTVAATSYSYPFPVNTNKARKVTVYLTSNNAGALKVAYSVDGGETYITQTVTPTLDSATGKQTYLLTLDAPVNYVKYTYTETTSAGHIYGGITTVESVVI